MVLPNVKIKEEHLTKKTVRCLSRNKSRLKSWLYCLTNTDFIKEVGGHSRYPSHVDFNSDTKVVLLRAHLYLKVKAAIFITWQAPA